MLEPTTCEPGRDRQQSRTHLHKLLVQGIAFCLAIVLCAVDSREFCARVSHGGIVGSNVCV